MGNRSARYPFASRSIDRSAYLSALSALLYWSLSSHGTRMLHQNDGIRRRRAPNPAFCHFLSAPGDSASSLLGRLRQSNCLPLQECIAWEFDISFCGGVRSPRARNKSIADLRSCASLLWRLLLLRPHTLLEGPGYVAMCTDRWQGHTCNCWARDAVSRSRHRARIWCLPPNPTSASCPWRATGRTLTLSRRQVGAGTSSTYRSR